MNKYEGQKKISLPEDPNMIHGSYLDGLSKEKKNIHGSYLDGLVNSKQNMNISKNVVK